VGFLLIRQSFIADPLPSRGVLAIGLLYIGLAPSSFSKGLTSLFYAFERAEYPAAVTTITTMNKAVFGLIALLLGYGIVGLAGVSIATNIITLAILLWEGRKLIRLTSPLPPSPTERGRCVTDLLQL
jgi:O-antigen/teichoic acid export membrane protein